MTMELFFVTDYKVNYNQEAVTSSPDEVTNVASHLQEGTVTGSHRSKRVPGVYGFVKDLILEGEHAKFVDDNGRYWINWLTAPRLYHKFRAKNYPKLSSECNQKAARKTLSAALIDSFKSQGAVEYDEYKKVNIKNGQVLERQFQMPPRIFESLFGSDYSGGFVSAEPETSEISLSDPEVTQVVGDIFPSPGHVKGGCPLQLTTESDTTGVARFDGEDVLSEKTNSYSFLSCIPDFKLNYNEEAVPSSPDELTNVASHLQKVTVTGTSTTADFATAACTVLLHGRLTSLEVTSQFVEN
ncbi:uncharacterized protein LOC111325029 [Stylophora pistillata]|uniref:uncharacterized protein LOC111325029 n=1 Tax=Stylophora pistillata TaxID=50429 RepID=UPI000C054B1E|nr:uncharacterized protein LOC111325029 [Stylophora pistillata]